MMASASAASKALQVTPLHPSAPPMHRTAPASCSTCPSRAPGAGLRRICSSKAASTASRSMPAAKHTAAWRGAGIAVFALSVARCHSASALVEPHDVVLGGLRPLLDLHLAGGAAVAAGAAGDRQPEGRLQARPEGDKRLGREHAVAEARGGLATAGQGAGRIDGGNGATAAGVPRRVPIARNSRREDDLVSRRRPRGAEVQDPVDHLHRMEGEGLALSTAVAVSVACGKSGARDEKRRRRQRRGGPSEPAWHDTRLLVVADASESNLRRYR